MSVLTRRALLGAAPVALAGAAVVAHPAAAHAALDPSGGTLLLVTPFRLHDSRGSDGAGAKFQVGDSTSFAVPDLATVHGVVVNATLVDTEGTGFLRVADAVVWPAPTSNVNWYADGQIVANLAVVHTHGEAKITVQFGGRTGSKTHLVLDVIGYVS